MSADLVRKRVEHELFLRAFLSTKPPDRVATQLSAVTRDTHLDRGDVLFRAGESPEGLHFVATGRIHLETLEGVTSIAEAGSLLGMLDASIPRARTRTAAALEPTHVLTLDFADYLDILEDNFGFAVDILRSAAQSYGELARQLDAGVVFEPLDGGAVPCVPPTAAFDVVERVLVLQHVGLFRGAPAQALVQLAHLAEVHHWNAGEPLFSSGDSVTKAHVVAVGRVLARHEEANLFGSFAPHQIVSDLGILGVESHEFSARAETASVTIDIDVEDLFDVAEDQFELWRSMLSYIASQRARLNEAAAPGEVDLGRLTL